MITIEQQQKIAEHINRFAEKGEGYKDFLVLVAQPFIFSTDLLYKIWLNFKTQAHYLVVSDLLNTSFCRPIGANQFRLEEQTRQYLLEQKLEEKTQKELAQFVAEYTQQNRKILPKNIYTIYKIWATGITNFKEMETEIVEQLQKEGNSQKKIDYLSLYVKTLAQKPEGSEQANINLRIAQEHEKDDVLQGYFSEDILGRLGKEQVEKKDEKGSNIISRKILTKLLQEAYNSQGIDMLCYANFEDAYYIIETLSTKDNKIIKLIQYCEQHFLVERLLEIIKEERPTIYQKYIPILSQQQAQEIIELIQKNEIVKVFELLEKYQVKSLALDNFKKEFIYGNFSYDFYKRLELFVNILTQTGRYDINQHRILFKEEAEEIISLIQNAEIFKTFEKLDEYKVRNAQLNVFRNEYILGEYKYDFYDRLQVLVNTLVYKHDIFFSYSSKNAEQAKIIVDKLRKAGLSVFYAEDSLDMDKGLNFTDIIQEALKNSQNFILYCTKDAMNSNWVKHEYEVFYSKHILDSKQNKFFILSGEDYQESIIPEMLRSIQISKNIDDIIKVLKNDNRKQSIQENLQPQNPILDLSNQGILDIRNEIPELFEATHIEVLHLENNKLTHFPEDLLEKLPNLKELYLYVNPIENLPKDVFNFEGSCLENIKAYFTNSNKKTIEIIELEKQLGFELTKAQNANHILDVKKNRTYLVNDNQEVIGLNLYDCNLTNVSFLNRLTNLVNLNLQDNRISDISFLQGLTKLTSLYLSNNRISDVSALQGLTNLTNLYLGHNQISDALSLRNLISLKKIYLSHNIIRDLSFLQNLIDLEVLIIGENQITDISGLKNLINLQTLRLGDNQISDILDLVQLPKLSVVRLGGNNIRYFPIQLLSNENLSYLKLHLNPIENLPKEFFDFDGNCLERLKSYFNTKSNSLAYQLIQENIRTQNPTLDLGNCGLSNLQKEIPELFECVHLEHLSLGRWLMNPETEKWEVQYQEKTNNISSLEGIEKLKNLKVLSLHENQISDLTPVGKLENLEILNCYKNYIVEISPLTNCKKLRKIILWHNQVADLSPLSNLINLTHLSFADNQVTNLSTISNLVNLKELLFSRNKVSDISIIANLKNLEKLKCINNQITHFPQDLLEKLSNLKELYLYGNPIENLPKDVFDNGQEISCLERTRKYVNETNKNYTETINGVSFEMIWVEGTDTNNPFLFQGEKKVQLDGFYVAKFETTQALYEAVMGKNPSYFKGANKPVERVNWFDAMAFTEKLSKLTGKKYSLPSEAQWEYAAKGGRLSKGYQFAGSNNIDEVACYYENSGKLGEKHADYGTHNVGRYKANELGIYDMSGNVWEWCLDEWESNIVEKIPDNFSNPLFSEDKIINSNTFKNTAKTTHFVIRGGAFFKDTDSCAVRYRNRNDAGDRNFSIGFRCVLVF